MNVKLLYTLLLLSAGTTTLFSQTFAPLGGYDFPVERTKPLPVIPKMVCSSFDDEGIFRVAPGESIAIPVGTDTIGLGDNPAYLCTGCPIGEFGTGQYANDTLFYTANPGNQEGLETFSFRACEQDGGTPTNNCSPTIEVTILVQREGTTTSLGNQTVDPSGTIDIEIPLGNLPASTFCRTVESCSDDYPGREQRAFFQFGINQDNEIRYVAARAAGTDQVCVTLCTEFGLCDVYTVNIAVARPTVELPFFDDFSYNDFRPDTELWQDEDVLVNRNFAVLPPSIGVATFDAVDFDGQPYTTVSGTGPTKDLDYLTSSPVNLAGRNDVNLSFYVQPRGLGNRPERQDSFLVQFLDIDNNWQTVLGIQGIRNTVGNDQELPFEPYTISVPVEYLYSGFQFRFVNKGNERGAVDMWHLDYVKLDDGGVTFVTQDLALVQTPEVLLEPYTSLPLRHYQAEGESLLRDSITFAVFNHRNDVTPVTTGNINVRQASGTSIPGASGGLISTNLFPGGTGIEARSYDIRRADLAGWNGYAPLVNFLASADPDQALKITNFYGLTVLTETSGYAPGILENSNIGTPTCFDEYLAYDDGTAELTIEIDAGGTILQQYDTYVNDELLGVQVRLPRGLGELGNQGLKLVVYVGDTVPDELVYEEEFEILYPEDLFFDSLQGYTTYLFDEPLDLPAGTVYVGWEQQSANRNIGVGFDRNNSPENVQWFSLGNDFQRLTGTTTGAIMLRPLLSGFSDFQTDTEEPFAAEQRMQVFPNPTSSTLHLRPRPDAVTENLNYRLFNFSGALLRSGPANRDLDLSALPAGVYLLEITDGTHREQHRVVRQ